MYILKSWERKLCCWLFVRRNSYSSLKGSWKSAGCFGFFFWHEDEFIKATNLFFSPSSLQRACHSCRRKASRQSVEAAYKDKKIMVNTRNTLSTGSQHQNIWVVTTVQRNHNNASYFPASNRAGEMWDYTSRSPSVSLGGLMFLWRDNWIMGIFSAILWKKRLWWLWAHQLIAEGPQFI